MQVLHEMTLVGIKSVFHATEEPGGGIQDFTNRPLEYVEVVSLFWTRRG